MLYAFEGYVLDPARRELRRGAESLAVEPQVFDLIAYLIENRERVVSKDDLRAGVWQGRIVSESTQSYYINAARTAIGDNGDDQRLIRTLPRKGFRFVAPVREEQESKRQESDAVPAVASAVVSGGGDLAPQAREQHHDLVAAPVGAPPAVAEPRRAPRTMLMVSAGAGLVAVAAIALFVWRAAEPPPGKSSIPSGQRFDSSIVPLIEDETRKLLASYPNRPDFKALAITGGGNAVADGAPNAEAAKEEALRQCNTKTKRQCRLYAVGMDVVWSKEWMPLPAMSDLRFEPLDIPLVADEVPFADQARREWLAKGGFMKAPNHRALAVTRTGIWAINTKATRAEATRLAIERCAEYWQRPCLLVAVDGLLTTRIPKSRQVVTIFLPSTETELGVDDRERIAKIYQGADWRALARGKNGWHAVAAAPSEEAAIESALQLCAQADQECQLYAIGNFRVPGG